MWLTETIQTINSPDGADRLMTITSVIMAFLSSMFTGLFAWLNQRDKMRFNADRLRMEGKFELQAHHSDSQARTIARMQKEVENCHKERDEQKLKIANLERQVAELRQVVDAGRWRAGGEN